MISGPRLPSFPVQVLVAWLLLEAFHRLRPQSKQGTSHGWIMALWFARPWAAWAALNWIFRHRVQDVFNDPFTFPFYADLWRQEETVLATLLRLGQSASFWGWSASVLVLGGATLGLASGAGATVLSTARRRMLLALTLLLAIVLPLAMACVPAGITAPPEAGGSLILPWYSSASTMLYCMPLVEGTGDFLRHFEALQPRLKVCIHGASAPPGATLTHYWMGKLAGAGADFRAERLRYALALTVVSALGAGAVYLLARDLFLSPGRGLLAALLWVVSPAFLSHATFAPDGPYAAAFILALWLAWRTVQTAAISWENIAGFGLTLFALTMLKYSWTILAAQFGLFLVLTGLQRRWPLRQYLLRGGLPLLIAAALLAGVCGCFRLNYWHAYRWALDYVNGWYSFSNSYQWLMATLGGQIELGIMMGAVVCSLFLGQAVPGWRRRPRDGPSLFGLVTIGVYLLPILFGPNPVRMETSRLWGWMLAVPLVFVADRILAMERPRFLALWTVGLSLAQYYVMRLFVQIEG